MNSRGRSAAGARSSRHFWLPESIDGATVQGQDNNNLQVLVHGNFTGYLPQLGIATPGPDAHDFAASISW